MKTHPIPSVLVLSIAFLVACSTGGGSGGNGSGTGSTADPGSSSTANVQIMIGSTGASDLFALGGELSELRLVETNGTRSGNLLKEAKPIEWIGLEGTAVLVAELSVATGTYEAIEFEFTPGSLFAMDDGGSHVDVRTAKTTFEAPLESNWVAKDGDEASLFLDVDLSGSVIWETLTAMELDPDGLVTMGLPPRPLQEFRGRVLSTNESDGLLTIEAIGGANVSFGELKVAVSTATRLVDVDGTRFPGSVSFFASLRPELTMIKVRGTMTGFRTMTADVISITDQAGGPDPDVVIEGLVLRIDRSASFFVLLMRTIERGEGITKPTPEAIGSRNSIDVYFDDETTFQLRDGTEIDSSELAVGQIARATFNEFSTAPFRADLVELRHRRSHICLKGEIESVRGLPEEFVVAVNRDDWHRRSGRIQTEKVRVKLAEGAEVILHFRGTPSIPVDRLVTGLTVRVCGELLGTLRDPVLVAERVFVRPGFLVNGVVEGTSPLRSRYTLSRARIVQSFGNTVTGAPLSVMNHPRARFLQDARSEAEFFRLFEALADDEYLDVRIKGLGTDVAEEIEAFEVKSEIRQLR